MLSEYLLFAFKMESVIRNKLHSIPLFDTFTSVATGFALPSVAMVFMVSILNKIAHYAKAGGQKNKRPTECKSRVRTRTQQMTTIIYKHRNTMAAPAQKAPSTQ